MIFILPFLFATGSTGIPVGNEAGSIISINTNVANVAVSSLKNAILSYKNTTQKQEFAGWKSLREKVQDIEDKVEAASKDISKLEKNIKELNNKVKGLNSTSQAIGVCKLKNINCHKCLCEEDDRLLLKYYCNCRHVAPMKDCRSFKQQGYHTSGVYIIKPQKSAFEVFCDQMTDGGGWNVFQRRIDGSIKFYRNWEYYKRGFGAPQHEFWLGNDYLFEMSNNPRNSELRIDMEYFNAGWKKFYAKYNKFAIDNEQSKYALHISGYSGNNGDSLGYHNGMKFSTFDQDNDKGSSNCALSYKGAWWYNHCYRSNLNGYYYDYNVNPAAGGIQWYTYDKHTKSMAVVEMKMRSKQ